jgi:hypothetical protein
MPVFSRYNPRSVGDVLKQAKPNATALPRKPHNYTTRIDTQWGGRGRVFRVQPHERGTWFTHNPFPGTTAATPAAPSLSSGGCGCGGRCSGMPIEQAKVGARS